MDKTGKFFPPNGFPPEGRTDAWLNGLSYRRLLSLTGSLLLAVKSPDAELRKLFNTARSIRCGDRSSDAGQAAKIALTDCIRNYLALHRTLDPTRVTIDQPQRKGFPEFTEFGTLPPGFWHVTLKDFQETLTFNQHRKAQAKLLCEALALLKAAGCRKVMIAGSFASPKPKPSDIDMMWDADGIDRDKLDPIFSEDGLALYSRFGTDASCEAWKLKLSLVQSLWGVGAVEAQECSVEEYADLPRFRAVGVLVLDLVEEQPEAF